MEQTPQNNNSEPQKKTTDGGIQRIRTYQDDVAHAVKEQNESLISIRTKELDKQSREGTRPEEKKKSDTGMLFTALFLLIIGFIVIVNEDSFVFFEDAHTRAPIYVLHHGCHVFMNARKHFTLQCFGNLLLCFKKLSGSDLGNNGVHNR